MDYLVKYNRFKYLDVRATLERVSKLINESGLNDKQIGKLMNLSVQSINKWRHGHNLPDIENMYMLGGILGRRVDELLVPRKEQYIFILENVEISSDPFLMAHRLMEYAERLKLCS